MEENQVIEFLRKKDFKFIQKLSNGSFGQTILLKDEYINHKFVCKKYEPQDGIEKEDYYINFVNEIKLLHLLYHDNIVRVFNYYLYPEQFTGYILMEYIDGMDLYTYIEKYPENINNIFEQVIKGFKYLEDNTILHRDIRPTNILIDNNNNVKIIDFGFGKKINFKVDNAKSITINWWGNEKPSEFSDEIYDTKTEVFFIGKLFEELLHNVETSFKYKSILKRMITTKHNMRIDSFKNILHEFKNNIHVDNPFNKDEKEIYQKFSYTLFSSIINRGAQTSQLNMESNEIIKNLEFLQKKIMLEDFVNPKHLLKIFVSGNYNLTNQPQYCDVADLTTFLHFFKGLTHEKKNMVLYGLEIKFDDIETYDDLSDEIPF